MQVTNGILTGATGVEVGGELYNVEFRDGSCVGLFSQCDAAADFVFQSSVTASAASRALLDSVLVDGPSGMFDSIAALTRGCARQDCILLTPYAIEVLPVASPRAVLGSVAQNFSIGTDSVFPTAAYAVENDFENDPFATFAIWTRAGIPPVPEPGKLALFGAGLLVLALTHLRRTRHQ